MNRNALVIIIILVVVIVVGGIAYLALDSSSSTVSPTTNSGMTMPMTSTTTSATTTEVAPGTTPVSTTNTQASTEDDITVNASNYSFSPTQVTVKKGDTVKITFVNNLGYHDFHIDAFNVAAQPISAGNQEVVSFVANKTGSFQYYCSFHKSMGMVGTLTVTE